MNILIKLMSIVSLIIAPHISLKSNHGAENSVPAAIEQTVADGTYLLVNEESKVTWFGRKVGGTHFGSVNFNFGKLNMASGIPQEARFEVNMTSLTVDDIQDAEMNGKLKGHLNSEDFFNTAQFASASLYVNSFENISNNVYKASGTLTIKNIEQPVDFTLTLSNRENVLVGNADLTFDRTAYDIKFKSKTFFTEFADNFIYDEVSLKINFKMKM
jgi:polyisoprenoid-binding protein YceI